MKKIRKKLLARSFGMVCDPFQVPACT